MWMKSLHNAPLFPLSASEEPHQVELLIQGYFQLATAAPSPRQLLPRTNNPPGDMGPVAEWFLQAAIDIGDKY